MYSNDNGGVDPRQLVMQRMMGPQRQPGQPGVLNPSDPSMAVPQRGQMTDPQARLRQIMASLPPRPATAPDPRQALLQMLLRGGRGNVPMQGGANPLAGLMGASNPLAGLIQQLIQATQQG
jgi:hypothetical protein